MSVNKYISTVLVWLMCTSPLVAKPGKLGKRLTALEEKVDKLSKKVAFTAASEHRYEYKGGDTVKFNVVIYNEGGYYDKATNKFTCPMDGTYFFYTNMLAFRNSHMHAIIEVINAGKPSVLAHASGVTADIWNSGSNVVFTKCAQNQKVHVITMFYNNTVSGSQDDGEFEAFPTTFSGLLVSPDV